MMVGAALDGIMGFEANDADYREEQMPVPASRLSIRETVMVVDSYGTLATWGNMFVKEQ
jgi:hypothetical protein